MFSGQTKIEGPEEANGGMGVSLKTERFRSKLSGFDLSSWLRKV